jgi:Arc/MetJ-type ribon-helix-helix transcriptional regulator
MSSASYRRQFTIQVTDQTLQFIDALALRQHTSRAEIVRQAIREYLDTQENVIGSRTRFGNKVARQLEEVQNRLSEQQIRADTLLLAAIILLQMRQGTQGSDVLTQIARLAAHAGKEIRATLVAVINETDSGPSSKPRPAR